MIGSIADEMTMRLELVVVPSGGRDDDVLKFFTSGWDFFS